MQHHLQPASMENIAAQQDLEIQISSPPQQPSKVVMHKKPSKTVCQIFVRVLATLALLAASLSMFLNQETTVVAGFLNIHASYNSDPTSRFFVFGNAAACFYTFLSLPLLFLNGSEFFIKALDLLALGLVVSCAAASTAIGYLSKYGNNNTGWMSVCNYTEKFCSRANISIGCSYLSFLLWFIICLMNSIQKPKAHSSLAQ